MSIARQISKTNPIPTIPLHYKDWIARLQNMDLRLYISTHFFDCSLKIQEN